MLTFHSQMMRLRYLQIVLLTWRLKPERINYGQFG